MRAKLLVIFLAFLLRCDSPYIKEPELGDRLSFNMLRNTQKIIPYNGGYIFSLKLPHKKEPFMSKKWALFCDHQLNVILKFVLNESILTIREDSIVVYSTVLKNLEINEIPDWVKVSIHQEKISEMRQIKNTVIENFYYRNDFIYLIVRRSSSSKNAAFHIEGLDILKEDSVFYKNLFDKPDTILVKMKDLIFDHTSNEICIKQLSGQKELTERFVFAGDLRLEHLILGYLQDQGSIEEGTASLFGSVDVSAQAFP